MLDNPIDNLLYQIDNEELQSCSKCKYQTKCLFKISCNHYICVKCIENSIDNCDYNLCPICNQILTKNLHDIFSEFLNDPISKLSYYHDINIGDIVWLYSGNGHNWLYSYENCSILNAAFDIYLSSDTYQANSKVELQLNIGGNVESYIVDFDEQIQYPKNSYNKKRNISTFKLKSVSDLRKNKIIGIAGKLL